MEENKTIEDFYIEFYYNGVTKKLVIPNEDLFKTMEMMHHVLKTYGINAKIVDVTE